VAVVGHAVLSYVVAAAVFERISMMLMPAAQPASCLAASAAPAVRCLPQTHHLEHITVCNEGVEEAGCTLANCHCCPARGVAASTPSWCQHPLAVLCTKGHTDAALLTYSMIPSPSEFILSSCMTD
jgi:hypothetical protein